jgi:hypothetical protein
MTKIHSLYLENWYNKREIMRRYRGRLTIQHDFFLNFAGVGVIPNKQTFNPAQEVY